jgi:NADH-quinone oxidoreductase subunit G
MEAALMTDAIRTSVTVTVNGRAVTAQPGELLIEVAERAGDFIPRFCYHPRMEPVGVCRMCLVEVDGPRGPSLQPACYLRVNDGMNVTTDSEKVKKAQDGVLEFLLANHPLDCPVCDKGGECPLQDQAMAHGSGETRFIEEKRHFVKPISIGANVLLDRERCIQCSRCTRFAADVAGDAQIAFAGRGDLIEVAPSPSEPFDSVFSGNTVQICPVGALTAKPYRFSSRPWDLEQVESTCTTCAVGCRVAVQSSGNRLTRVLGVDAEPVNQGWLCDKGRFGLDSIDGNEGSSDVLSPATRIAQPMIRRNGELEAVSWGTALAKAADILLESGGGDFVGAIGGAALTNEAAFAWERFVRGVLHSDHLDAQFGDGLDPVLVQALPAATIADAATARVVVTLTGDLREELPVLFLRLRENIVRRKNTLIEFSTVPSALHALARYAFPTRPGEAPVVAKALVEGSVPVGTLLNEATIASAKELLGDGEGVVFVVGRPNQAESSVFIEQAIMTLATGFPRATFLPALRRSNVRGALDMGLSPRLLPGRVLSSTVGRDTLAQLEALRDGSQKALLLLGGCLIGNMVDDEAARDALRAAAGRVVAVTGHGGATLAYADVVLPAQVQHERLGTVTNIEGRVTAVVPKISAPGSAWSDIAIAAELAQACGQSLGLTSVEQAAKTIEEATGYPALSVLQDQTFDGVVIGGAITPSKRSSMDPMAFPGIRSTNTTKAFATAGATQGLDAQETRPLGTVAWSDVVVAATEAPLADAYALRVVLARRLYDDGITMQGAPALRELADTTSLRVHHVDLDRLSFADGDAVRVSGATGSFDAVVTADDTVVPGTVLVGAGSRMLDGSNVQRFLLDPTSPLTQVRMTSR